MPPRLDSIDPRSRRLLEEAGYRFHRENEMWINNPLGRAISDETVRNHDPAWLQHWLQESN